MIKKTSLLFALIIFLASSTIFAKVATLKGKVINNKDYTEINLQDIQGNNIETQKLDKDGNFAFEMKFKSFDFYILSFERGKFVAFFPEPGEKTEMLIDIKDLKNPKITNSVQSNLFYEYSKQIGSTQNKEKRASIVKDMIDKHTNSPVCVLFVDILSKDTDIAYHNKLVKGLDAYSDNSMISDFIKSIKNAENLKVGGLAPEIELNSPEGKPIKLSSTRGNYVLIDFWASWCRACRAENPNNVKLYKKYHDKGFEIYGVSLDKSKDAWLKAIKDDNLTWIHVSDLKFWQSEGAKTYNVRGIPHTVLLDKEGKIIATGLRGKALEDKLEELFGE